VRLDLKHSCNHRLLSVPCDPLQLSGAGRPVKVQNECVQCRASIELIRTERCRSEGKRREYRRPRVPRRTFQLRLSSAGYCFKDQSDPLRCPDPTPKPAPQRGAPAGIPLLRC
jgi:hypothetical protein